jgi:hypothetical protein
MRWAAILLVLAMGAAGDNISGKWHGNFRAAGADHDVPQILTLQESPSPNSGAALKGSGGPDATEQYPIANGHIAGDRVHFEITTGEWKFFYDLKLSGQTMAGQLTLKSATDTRSAQVKLTRAQ